MRVPRKTTAALNNLPEVRALDYSDPATFEVLWTRAESWPEEHPLRQGGVVVVIDPRRELKGDLERYISVYDWVVFALHSLREAGTIGVEWPDLRIEVMGPSPLNGSEDLRTPGYEVSGIQWAPGRTLGDADRLAAEGDLASRPRLDRTNLTEVLPRIGASWRAELTRRGGNHHITNLIAPLLIQRGMNQTVGKDGGEDEGKSKSFAPGRETKALVALLASLGLVNSDVGPQEPVDPLTLRPRIYNNVMGRFDSVRFYLVDDDASQGFDRVLPLLLGVDPDSPDNSNLSFSHTSKSDWASPTDSKLPRRPRAFDRLLDDIEVALSRSDRGDSVDWDLPRVLRPRVSDSANAPTADVLLLDLRLFGEDDTPKEPERESLERLLELVYATKLQSAPDPFVHRAIDAVNRRLYPGKGPASLLHLALLPLLIAHTDPSLPVVIFSSTRQRSLMQAFENHPSLITTFVKPGATGYAEGAPNEAVASLLDALEEAMMLHEARGVWERIEGASWQSAPPHFLKHPTLERAYVGYNYETVEEAEDAAPDSIRGRVREVAARIGLLDDRPLRVLLRSVYERYILEGQFLEFHAALTRFTERILVPDTLKSKGDKTGLFIDWGQPANRQYLILDKTRNRVAHGSIYDIIRNPNELEALRTTSLIGFNIWIDWITTGTPTPLDGDGYQTAKEKSEALSTLLSERVPSYSPPTGKPWLLNFSLIGASRSMNWLDAYVARTLESKTGSSAVRYSETTETAMARAIELALSPRELLDPPDAEPVDNRVQFVGDVRDVRRDSFSILPRTAINRRKGWPSEVPEGQALVCDRGAWVSDDPPIPLRRVTFSLTAGGKPANVGYL